MCQVWRQRTRHEKPCWKYLIHTEDWVKSCWTPTSLGMKTCLRKRCQELNFTREKEKMAHFKCQLRWLSWETGMGWVLSVCEAVDRDVPWTSISYLNGKNSQNVGSVPVRWLLFRMDRGNRKEKRHHRSLSFVFSLPLSLPSLYLALCRAFGYPDVSYPLEQAQAMGVFCGALVTLAFNLALVNTSTSLVWAL